MHRVISLETFITNLLIGPEVQYIKQSYMNVLHYDLLTPVRLFIRGMSDSLPLQHNHVCRKFDLQ
jgi:hypothetical protein